MVIIGALATVFKGLEWRLEEVEIGGIVETIQNKDNKISNSSEKNLGDLRRLAFIQTPVNDQRLMLVWKIAKE